MRTVLEEVEELTQEVVGVLIALNELRDRLASCAAEVPYSRKRYTSSKEWRRSVLQFIHKRGPSTRQQMCKAMAICEPSFDKAVKAHPWFQCDPDTKLYSITNVGLAALEEAA